MKSRVGFGQLNSAEHSKEPETIEPENSNGLELIIKNNEETTKPKVIKKLIGPFKGIVFKGTDDVLYAKKPDKDNGVISSVSNLLGLNNLPKHRIYIPELHSHLPDIGDVKDVPMTIASLYPEFIAETSQTPIVEPGTIVWCNFLDRENFKEPVYLGPVDEKKSIPGGISTAQSSVNPSAVGGGSFVGSPGQGDSIGGISFRNTSGQVSYPAVTGSWTGELPKNGFTATTATVDDLLNLAKQQIGKKEIPNGSNGGPEVDPFNGGRREAWCNASLSWLFRQIGAPLPGDKLPYPTPGLSPPGPSPGNVKRASAADVGWNRMHSVFFTEKYFRELGAFFSEPKPGDMIIYATQTDVAQVDATKHIGLVTEVNGDTLKTIEFNWGNTVAETHQDWRNGFIIKPDGSRYKAKYPIIGFARRPLPYSGVPGGQIVQQPERTAGPLPAPPANHPIYNIAFTENGQIKTAPVEMVYIQPGSRLLFPKKYFRALNAMMEEYQRQRGKKLNIVSAFRSYEQQVDLYNQYLQRNKAPPQVAPPGQSLHNSGMAIDIDMSEGGTAWSSVYNTEFDKRKSFYKDRRNNRQSIYQEAISGKFGPVAQWLVQNGMRFGFYWDGYSYRELWHYQIDLAAARAAGLLDE